MGITWPKADLLAAFEDVDLVDTTSKCRTCTRSGLCPARIDWISASKSDNCRAPTEPEQSTATTICPTPSRTIPGRTEARWCWLG
jgi:hypothetical protein